MYLGAVGRQPPLSAAFNWLPALNFGTVVAAMWTRSPVRGFTPWRAARSAAENLPNPVKLIESRLLSVSVTVSMKASTALPASRAERPLFAATLLMKSCFVKAFLLVRDAGWSDLG